MMAKILFIGGTGIISSACSPLALAAGHELFLLNRGHSASKRQPPSDAIVLQGDINDEAGVRDLLSAHSFDVVVNWIAFHPDNIERDLRLFAGRVGQYVFISSASAYQKPLVKLPITETSPLGNPFWEYARDKIACESRLMSAHRSGDLPVTIVRPSHTYDKTLLPFYGGYTAVARMAAGLPVIMPGDGSSLWVLTHHADFARGFVPLLGDPRALGEAFQITSDELLCWNQIYQMVANAFEISFNPLYVPSTVIARYSEDWGANLLGDSMHSLVFDNTRIKEFVPGFEARIPFSEGVQEVAAWYQADPHEHRVDAELMNLMDRIAADRSL
jgi:nucleoside-diphosphate-sugar epimerase